MALNNKFYEYIDQYKIMHSKQGYTSILEISPTWNQRTQIKEAVDLTDSKTMLDYGCASAVQYKRGKLDEFLGVQVSLYDPAIEEFSAEPSGTYDAVICYDVLEHIHEEHLDYVLSRLFLFADKLVMIKCGLAPAMAVLPNGENAHVTVRNKDWWKQKVAPHMKPGVKVLLNREWVA